MNELADIVEEIDPHEVLLVADAMTGQVAVDVAKAFNEQLDIDGCLLYTSPSPRDKRQSRMPSSA